jgi:hypothetical protein
MEPRRYRMRMTPLVRVGRIAVFAVCALVLGATTFASGPWWWRVASSVGLLVALLGLRTMLGAVVKVDDRYLTIQPYWPLRQRLSWYRIDHAEVVPGYWVVLLELNSGARMQLPCVDDIDDLYHRVEYHRKALDII